MNKIQPDKIKTWFITGASSGVGNLLCKKLLAGGGYNIIAVSRRIPNFQGNNVLCLSCDVTNIESVKNAVKLGIEKFGKIDVLVNNAGISTNVIAEDETAEHIKEVLEVNYFGAFNTIKVLLPHFRENKNGTIVNNTSQSGLRPREYGLSYCSSKHALEAMTSVLRLETQHFCRVMAFELGYYKSTEIIKKAYAKKNNLLEYKNLKTFYKPFKYGKFENSLPDAIDAIIETIHLEKIPRHLLLGADSIYFATSEMEILNNDIKYSNQYTERCSRKIKIKKNITYFKNYSLYLKYRILKNFVSGRTLERYRMKQKKYRKLLTV